MDEAAASNLDGNDDTLDFGLDLGDVVIDSNDTVVDFGITLEEERDSSSSNDANLESVDEILPGEVLFLDFQVFQQLNRIPMYPINQRGVIPLRKIDRSISLLVFVSHRWVADFTNPDSVKPDDDTYLKFNLCVRGIDSLWRTQAPNMSHCYIWIDCGCINQDQDPAISLRSLDIVIKNCDCLFTPLLDLKPDSKNSHPLLLQFEASARSQFWNEGPSAYLNRAWCRLEVLYASRIPILDAKYIIDSLVKRHTRKENRDKHSKVLRFQNFESKLLAHCKLGYRPHFVYGTQESKKSRPPTVLQVLKKHTYMEKYDPREGHLSKPTDLSIIESLTEVLLKNYKLPNEIGYSGDRNEFCEMHGFGTLNYDSGDSYTGEFKENMRHGYGIMKFSNLDCYKGLFKADLYHGQGKFEYSDKSTYDGEWVAGLKHGNGKFIAVNGDIYKGIFTAGKITGEGKLQFEDGQSIYTGQLLEGDFHGQGSLQSANGNNYKGNFYSGKKHGYGVLRSINGNVYKGHWVDDKRHGKGSLKTANGDFYEGEFKEGAMSGSGKYKFASGDIYMGELTNGQMHGNGVYMYSNGSVYEGAFQHGQSNGIGRYNFNTGDFYEGEWQDDKRYGRGVLRYKNGGEYNGDFVNNLKHGQGVFQYPNGEEYRGAFRNGKKWGLGIYHFSNSDIYEGEWVDDLIQGEGVMKYAATNDEYEGAFDNGVANGVGVFRFSNGDSYQGEVSQGRLHGVGKLIYANGDRYEGEFLNGKKWGEGSYTYAVTGKTVVGRWKEDKKKVISIGNIKKALLIQR